MRRWDAGEELLQFSDSSSCLFQQRWRKPGGEEGLPVAELTKLEIDQMWRAGRREDNSSDREDDGALCGQRSQDEGNLWRW